MRRTIIKVTATGKDFQRAVNYVRSVTDARYDPSAKMWSIPAQLEPYIANRGIRVVGHTDTTPASE